MAEPETEPRALIYFCSEQLCDGYTAAEEPPKPHCSVGCKGGGCAAQPACSANREVGCAAAATLLAWL